MDEHDIQPNNAGAIGVKGAKRKINNQLAERQGGSNLMRYDEREMRPLRGSNDSMHEET